MRALKSLEVDISAELASSRTLRENPAMRQNDPATGKPATGKPAAAKPEVPAADKPASSPAAAKTGPAPAAAQTEGVEREHATPADALLEVKPSPLNTDIDRIGERLVIFNDRVELRDRNDRVRQVIKGDDITDVVVHRKFTGATVTVESLDGTSIVAKGLRPDQAEEVRTIIQRRTRQSRPASSNRATPTRAASSSPKASSEASATPVKAIDAADLIAKLIDLHEAGVLTTEELEEKKALVARLANAEPLAATSG
jgi:hypothetical protein